MAERMHAPLFKPDHIPVALRVGLPAAVGLTGGRGRAVCVCLDRRRGSGGYFAALLRSTTAAVATSFRKWRSTATASATSFRRCGQRCPLRIRFVWHLAPLVPLECTGV